MTRETRWKGYYNFLGEFEHQDRRESCKVELEHDIGIICEVFQLDGEFV